MQAEIPMFQRIALIGYGEVGRILAEDLRAQGLSVDAYDLKLQRPEQRGALLAHAEAHGVCLHANAADALRQAQLVISAVTASQTVVVAEQSAPHLAVGAVVVDMNSASPGAKIQAGRAVDAASGRYVEAAVMTSVPPYRSQVPMLLGGPHAAAVVAPLNALGFKARVASERLGVASATKMCRSVMIKGLEAMAIESLTTARHYGVEDAVLASLYETFPGIDWEKQAAYFFQRVIEHGRRRSEEVLEVAHTVREAGLQPWSATGTAARQAWVADLADAGLFGERGTAGFARNADWRTEADRILARVAEERTP
ncbi:NAD(P)-dependent oxidoreductase [Aquincola tertiaricarbonis]|uniref:NAD(P)-dependent oxidoreductase n=1 Tax=Aquincola tertiaricarbonis TaxID=391953 RepID=UPI0006149EAF|nr:NAD(P)-dependent oxidoreductase [Aquincola tertiaricarbonis]